MEKDDYERAEEKYCELYNSQKNDLPISVKKLESIDDVRLDDYMHRLGPHSGLTREEKLTVLQRDISGYWHVLLGQVTPNEPTVIGGIISELCTLRYAIPMLDLKEDKLKDRGIIKFDLPEADSDED